MIPFQFTAQTAFYAGKVRDVYTIDNKFLVMVATNRISAFDVVLPRLIPYKGQVLNQIAAYMLDATSEICPNWLISTPAPHVAIGYTCEPFKIEMVVRGNLVGHAWRTYQTGNREICGETMPEGLLENDFFPTPLVTPSTKAAMGHDEDINAREIIALGLATAAQWEELERYALALFERGKALAEKRGLILADTKYEFGLLDNRIVLMDEIHTPDSSRYFLAAGFDERQQKGERQTQLSKEFVREWLMANGFMGKTGEQVPDMTTEWIDTISSRYTALYEKLIGTAFVPGSWTDKETFAEVERAMAILRNQHIK